MWTDVLCRLDCFLGITSVACSYRQLNQIAWRARHYDRITATHLRSPMGHVTLDVAGHHVAERARGKFIKPPFGSIGAELAQ